MTLKTAFDSNNLICAVATNEADTLELTIFRPTPQSVMILKTEIPLIIDALKEALCDDDHPVDYSL